MRISFDYDGTLGDNESIQDLARVLSKDPNVDLYILTSRDPKIDNRDLYQLIEDLNLNIKEVIFSFMQLKSVFIKNRNIDLHFDDNEEDIFDINESIGRNIAMKVNYKW